jgi:hypothetical protein
MFFSFFNGGFLASPLRLFSITFFCQIKQAINSTGYAYENFDLDVTLLAVIGIVHRFIVVILLERLKRNVTKTA